MKKIIAAILVLLVLGAPALVGILVEKRYTELTTQVVSIGFKAVDTEYQRGWFSSTVTSEFQLDIPAADKQAASTEVFTLSSEIKHGPLYSDRFALAEIITQSAELSALISDDRERFLRTLLFIDGSGRSEIQWPAVEGAAENGMQFRFGAVQGGVSFDRAAEKISMQLHAPGGKVIAGDREMLDVGALSFESNTRPSVSGVALGRGEFRLDRLTVSDIESSEQLDLTGVTVTGTSQEEAQLVEIEADYRFATLQINGEKYGPAELRVQLGRLSAPVLSRMQQDFEEISRQNLSEMDMGMAILGLLTRTAAELLKDDPRFVIRSLQVDTPDGPLRMEFSLQTQGVTMMDVTNMPILFSKLQGDLSFQIPETLLRILLVQQTRQQVEQQLAQMEAQGQQPDELDPVLLEQQIVAQVDQQIAVWLGQGFISREGKAVTSVASLSSGLLSINGKTIPISVGQ